MLSLLCRVAGLAVAAAATPTAVVTGGGSGIGKALALELASAGMDTIIVGRRENALLSVASENTNIRPCAADISTPEGQAAIQACVGDVPLQLLVHNAAILELGALPSIGLSTWRSVMSANVEAPMFLTQALLPNLEKAGGSARVLLVSSGAADLPIPGMGSYCISKAALKMLWRTLSQELLAKGVHIGYCIPGLVDTAMPAAMVKSKDFMLQDVIAKRVESGDVHSAEEVGQWLAAVVDESKVNITLFREREHNIDMPGHDLGVKITLTTEAKMISGMNKPAGQEL